MGRLSISSFQRFKLQHLLLCGAILLVSCAEKKPAKVFTPPPVRPVEAKPAPEPPQLPAPPSIEGETTPLPAPGQGGLVIPSVPPPPVAPPKRRPVTPAPPKVATPKEIPVAPRLGQIFSGEQRAEYARDLNESLEQVNRILRIAAAKRLSADQKAAVQRIVTFQKQAEDARNRDLVTAVNLARRAGVLAQDLAQTLK